MRTSWSVGQDPLLPVEVFHSFKPPSHTHNRANQPPRGGCSAHVHYIASAILSQHDRQPGEPPAHPPSQATDTHTHHPATVTSSTRPPFCIGTLKLECLKDTKEGALLGAHTSPERSKAKRRVTHTHGLINPLLSRIKRQTGESCAWRCEAQRHNTPNTRHIPLRPNMMGLVAVNLAAVLGGLALSAPAADWPPAPGSGGAK